MAMTATRAKARCASRTVDSVTSALRAIIKRNVTCSLPIYMKKLLERDGGVRCPLPLFESANNDQEQSRPTADKTLHFYDPDRGYVPGMSHGAESLCVRLRNTYRRDQELDCPGQAPIVCCCCLQTRSHVHVRAAATYVSRRRVRRTARFPEIHLH
jgi:hypothetical protein